MCRLLRQHRSCDCIGLRQHFASTLRFLFRNHLSNHLEWNTHFGPWTQVIAPGIATYEKRSKADKVFLANAFVSLFNAVSAPVLAVLGMRSVRWGDLENNMNAAPDDHALRAVGLSCGYMLYDTLYCLYYREMRSPLMIAHHVLPVLFWPYCMLNNRMLPLVLFFVLTEVTNIGQHTRILLEKFDLKHSQLYTVVGTSWVVLFFLV